MTTVPLPVTEALFPTLTDDQMERLTAYGTKRTITAGDVLVESGDPHPNAFVILHGAIDAVRVGPMEPSIHRFTRGEFTGEGSLLTGRPAFIRIRAAEDGEVLALRRDDVLRVMQLESDIGDTLMRAFVLRRVQLIAKGYGDAVVLGSAHCSDTLRIREFLTRNGQPFVYLDLDTADDVQELLDRFGVTTEDVPVVICHGRDTLRNPTNERIAECLGFNQSIDLGTIRDVVIVGAGPAGLAAAVYAASEGLDALVIEPAAAGGQASASSRIENYLGFPNGITGQELAARAYAQAERFGADFLIARNAVRLDCERTPYAVELDGGQRIAARTVIIASGATYRRPDVPRLRDFEGAGVYYSATPIEAQLCRDEDVCIVGGGNSAGQAAAFLASTCRHVHIIVRGDGLAASMSRYLIRRLTASPRITIHARTQLVTLEGDRAVRSIVWRNDQTDTVEQLDIRHIFVMTGALPGTAWLGKCVVSDESGFVKTGPDLSVTDLAEAGWKLPRTPFNLETSLPGVFAVGDVRAGSMKRVASAAGEGASAVSLVHRALQQ